MKTAEELFQESIKHYRKLINTTTDLYDNMASLSPDMILERCRQVQKLQQKQAEVDTFITDVMINIGPQILNTAYIGEYQRILAEAKQSSDKVASKARTLRTLLRDEMEKLQHGQKGLAGYTAVVNGNVKSLHGSY